MGKGGGAPALKNGLGVEAPEDFGERCHQACSPGLMAGADAGTVIAVEIFVE
jgi:hypothetical protein